MDAVIRGTRGAGAGQLEKRARRRDRRRSSRLERSEQAQECAQCGAFEFVYGKRQVCMKCRRANADRVRVAKAAAAAERDAAGPGTGEDVDARIRDWKSGMRGTRYVLRFHKEDPWTALRAGMDVVHRLAFELRLDGQRLGNDLDDGVLAFMLAELATRAEWYGLDVVEVRRHAWDEVVRLVAEGAGVMSAGGRWQLVRALQVELEERVEAGATCGWCLGCVTGDDKCEGVKEAVGLLSRLDDARGVFEAEQDAARVKARKEAGDVREGRVEGRDGKEQGADRVGTRKRKSKRDRQDKPAAVDAGSVAPLDDDMVGGLRDAAVVAPDAVGTGRAGAARAIAATLRELGIDA